jgi:hypothetical protein
MVNAMTILEFTRLHAPAARPGTAKRFLREAAHAAIAVAVLTVLLGFAMGLHLVHTMATVPGFTHELLRAFS